MAPPPNMDDSRALFAGDPIAHGVIYEPDVYRSYHGSDVDLFRRHAITDPQAVAGCFVDFLGRVTDCTFLPSIVHLDGKASAALPVPGDGFYADAIEYTGLLLAIETSKREKFVTVEIGAGWGPWIAAAGVAARRRGFKQIDLIGVEASLGKIELMKKHLVDNGLRPATDETTTRLGPVTCKCVNGAVWVEDGTVYFPTVVATQDYGGSVATQDQNTDYRQLGLSHTPVAASTMRTLLSEYDVIDFVHIDIQGAETQVCEQAISFIKERCRYLFIGTHSRTIEGDLVTLLKSSGMEIIREKPCRFRFDTWTGHLEGMTYADGGQLWVNPNL